MGATAAGKRLVKNAGPAATWENESAAGLSLSALQEHQHPMPAFRIGVVFDPDAEVMFRTTLHASGGESPPSAVG